MKLIVTANIKKLIHDKRPDLRVGAGYMAELENYIDKEIRRSLHRVNGSKTLGKEHVQ